MTQLTETQEAELRVLVREFHKDISCTFANWATHVPSDDTEDMESEADILERGTTALHTWYQWRCKTRGIDYDVFRKAYSEFRQVREKVMSVVKQRPTNTLTRIERMLN